MRCWLIPVSVVTALLIAGCESRPPLNRGQAVGSADNLQRERGLAWGDPEESLEPATAGTDGHRWWQLRYRDGGIILVDADSGWARLPPADYVARARAVPRPASDPAPVVIEEGSLVLRLTEPAEIATEREGELEREAARLNQLATRTGLHPLFSLRTDRQGRACLLYGWQGDRGIARDERVAEWVRLRTVYATAWVDLLPE